jgi:BirA family biotin operon repressor/biotin-[acetyl-CoA-carboxylase] ligase
VELGARARAHGARLVVLDEIDSTNEEAKRRASAGERGSLWIVARRQTKGRGRLGRQWSSLEGNLHASLLLGDIGPASIAPQLGFVAGVATISALIDATGAAGRLALKWPNDILLDGGKLAGILLESAPAASGFACVIGVGVNCATSPDGLPGPVSDLSRFSPAPTADEIFARLSDRMIETLELFAKGAGFPALRERWLAHAAGLGRDIRVALPHETIEGRFETIDAGGRLIISSPMGQRVIEAGDVFLPKLSASEPEPEGRP